MKHLANITPEKRIEMTLKAQEKRAELREAGKSLFHDFEDEKHWKQLASLYGIRLPAKHIPSTQTKYLKRVAKKLNFDYKDYLEDCGAKTLKQLVEMNENWPAYSEVSLMLEWWDEKVKGETKYEL